MGMYCGLRVEISPVALASTPSIDRCEPIQSYLWIQPLISNFILAAPKPPNPNISQDNPVK